MCNEVRKIKKKMKMTTYKEKLGKMKTLLVKLKCICEDVSSFGEIYRAEGALFIIKYNLKATGLKVITCNSNKVYPFYFNENFCLHSKVST